jgi:hypothetical protein
MSLIVCQLEQLEVLKLLKVQISSSKLVCVFNRPTAEKTPPTSLLARCSLLIAHRQKPNPLPLRSQGKRTN